MRNFRRQEWKQLSLLADTTLVRCSVGSGTTGFLG